MRHFISLFRGVLAFSLLGIAYGTGAGGIFGTLFIPVIRTIWGAFWGGIAGFVGGTVAGSLGPKATALGGFTKGVSL